MSLPFTKEDSDSDFMADEEDEPLYVDSDDEVPTKPTERKGAKGSIASSTRKTPMATSALQAILLMISLGGKN